MSSQNPREHDDEIWNELFGGNDNSSSKKGRSSLAPSKKNRGRPAKKRKIDHSSSSSSGKFSSSKPNIHSSSTTNGHHPPSRNNHTSTSTTSSSAYHQDGPTTVERLSQFLCTPKHRARLPPPPLKPKYLLYPHDKNRFVKYCGTNLELNYNWQLHHDSYFGLPLDLMDPDYYNPLKNPTEYEDDTQNHKADERILELLDLREAKRNAKEDRSLPEQEAFLLQTQYLTGGQEYELTESQRKTYDQNSNGYGSNRNGRKGRNSKKRRRDYDDDEDDLSGEDGYEYNGYNKRNNPHSIDNVRQTFIDIQNITRHPRRNVEVAKIFDVFPHEGLLEIDYTHVQFDNNPSIHTKKCGFMPKYKEERMKLAAECTNYSLLQCVNQKGLQLERKRNSKEENDDDDDEDTDLQLNKLKNTDPDWFTLYATDDGKKKVSEDEVTRKYEWSAEYKPVGMEGKKMHFMVIPKDNNSGEHEEVFYANFDDRISLRHRITDTDATQSMLAGNNRLSETDKRFFQSQPFNIKLSVPHLNDSEVE